MPVTIAQLAETLGVSKGTVRNKAEEIGIYSEIRQVGGRGTRVLTDEQASQLAHVISGTTLTAADLGGSADIDIEELARMRSELERAKSEIDDRDRQIIAMEAETEELRGQIRGLEAKIAILRRMREEDQDCIAGLMHAWPWGKRAVFEQWKKSIDQWRDRLLPPGTSSDHGADDVPGD